MGKVRKFINTWVLAKDSKDPMPKGELYAVTPDGKTTISAVLGTYEDARKIKAVIDILFPEERKSHFDIEEDY